MQLVRSGLVVARANGVVEHPVHVVHPDGTSEVLVHLAVLPSGHASVIDYDAHPDYANPHTPERFAAKVATFLQLGGERMLGHPNSPPSASAEAAKVKARHGLPQA